jgi:hypothetical protein
MLSEVQVDRICEVEIDSFFLSVRIDAAGAGSSRGSIMAYVGNGEEIKVIFNDGVARNVPAYLLDHLIREKRIIAFRRADGWVNVGRDLLRKHQRPTNH